MGQEGSKLFTPPNPPSYGEDLPNLIWIPSEGKTKVPTILLKYSGDESPYFTVVYFGGRSDDLTRNLAFAKTLKDTLHVNVCIFDYTGYGLNEGEADEESCYADASTVWKWLIESQGIKPERIVFIAKCIGTGVAVQQAHDVFPPLKGKGSSKMSNFSRIIRDAWTSPGPERRMGNNDQFPGIAGLALLSPFTSILDITSKTHHAVITSDIFENKQKIDRIMCPILVGYPEDDRLIPKAQVKKLSKRCVNLWGDKIYEMEGVMHDTIENSSDTLDILVEFIDSLMPKGTTIKKDIKPRPDMFADSEQIVENWLASHGLAQYSTTLLASGFYTLDIIKGLQEIDIMAMGIDNEKDIKLLVDAVNLLKEEGEGEGEGEGESGSGDITTRVLSLEGEESSDYEEEMSEGELTPFHLVERNVARFSIDFGSIEELEEQQGGFTQKIMKGKLDGKSVLVQLIMSKQHQREVFFREIYTLMKLSHPNLNIPVAACTVAPDMCIITEYHKSGSLRDLTLTKKPITPQQRVKIGRQLTSALAYLHNQTPPIVHRDLTASSVLFDTEGNVKLSDFGIAKPPSFVSMAPEIKLNRTFTSRSDIFSLALIFWELLTGEIPYANYDSLASITHKAATEGFRLPLPEFNDSDLTIELWREIIQSCWEHKMKNRPTAIEVHKRIKFMAGMLGDNSNSASDLLLKPLISTGAKERNKLTQSDDLKTQTVITEVEDMISDLQDVLVQVRGIINDINDLEDTTQST